VRIRVRRKTEKEEKEEGQRPHHHHKNQLLIISVIITVFLMVAPAITNKYHIKYKISRIYQPYNLSSPHRWVFYRCKLNMAVKACKHSNLNVDVQLLLQTKLFKLGSNPVGKPDQLWLRNQKFVFATYASYLVFKHRFYHFLANEHGTMYDMGNPGPSEAKACTAKFSKLKLPLQFLDFKVLNRSFKVLKL